MLRAIERLSLCTEVADTVRYCHRFSYRHDTIANIKMCLAHTAFFVVLIGMSPNWIEISDFWGDAESIKSHSISSLHHLASFLSLSFTKP